MDTNRDGKPRTSSLIDLVVSDSEYMSYVMPYLGVAGIPTLLCSVDTDVRNG